MSKWTDWEPIPELRFFAEDRLYAGRLQQRWCRLRLHDNGLTVEDRAFEWRDVPTVLDSEVGYGGKS